LKLKYTFTSDDLEILIGIIEESSEHLNGIEEGILQLENDFDPNLLDSIFRAMHSVKGVAAFLDLVPIKDTAHALESFLTDMKKGLYGSSPEITDALLTGVDILNGLIAQLGSQVKALEGSSVSDKFQIELDEGGYQELVAQVEELRSNQIASSEPDMGEKDSREDNLLKTEFSPLYEQMVPDFIEEALEHLEFIEQKCLEAEKYPENSEILNSVLRGFHSIKGGAGVIASMQDIDDPADPVIAIKTLTHVTESLLQQHRNLSLGLAGEVVDLILAAVDKVTILISMLQGNKVEDFSMEHLLERIESYFKEKPGIKEEKKLSQDDSGKLPQQLAAFINISEQALESMQSLLAIVHEDGTINSKQTKQFMRALKSLAATARYLDYAELINEADKGLKFLDQYISAENTVTVTAEILSFLSSNYDAVKHLIEQKIAGIKSQLESVSPDYGEKKENKLFPKQLNGALNQPKRYDDRLATSDTVNRNEIALTGQAVAVEKDKQVIQQAKPSSEFNSQSVRVSQEKLDRLMNMIGELLISKNRIFHLATTINLEYKMPALSRKVNEVAAELAHIADELQNAIMSARMVPLRVLFQRYPRTIRDTARKTDKQVELIIEGEETELDKTVIEAINDPLVHILRNAVDHGIEAPQERTIKGKSPTGKIELKAGYQGNYVLIEITDDGKGLNPDEIKLKALRKGLLTGDQIENMSNEDALQLIFAPGFSTREEVSELSGRGVGMDVVKTNIEKVGGTVAIDSIIDQGASIYLKIPLSMSIIRGLLVESIGQNYIIPLDMIEETIKLPGGKIRFYKNNMVADIREEIIPLIRLQDVLQPGKEAIKRCMDTEMVSIVVIKCDGYKYGLIVDRFKNEQEYVIKALAEEIASLKIYSGATILGDGSVVLILNPAYLLQTSTQVYQEEQ